MSANAMLLLLLLLLLLNLYLTSLKPCWDSSSLLQKGSDQEGGELHDVVIQYYIKYTTNNKQN